MKDLIYRQAAIDDIKAVYKWHDTVTEDRILDHLHRLPSAQSLALTCDGCRFVGTLDTEFPCSRCIRREKDYYAQER